MCFREEGFQCKSTDVPLQVGIRHFSTPVGLGVGFLFATYPAPHGVTCQRE